MNLLMDWDGSCDFWLTELLSPPSKITPCMLGWGTWHEQTVTEHAHEGFQIGEVSPALCDDMADVE